MNGPAVGIGATMTLAMDFRLAADAALNATALTIQRHVGGSIASGMILSFGDGVMHLIVPPFAGDTGAADPIAVSVRPWLRAAYPAGTAVEFGTPTCRMKLATDDTAAMELQLSQFATVQVDLVQAP